MADIVRFPGEEEADGTAGNSRNKIAAEKSLKATNNESIRRPGPGRKASEDLLGIGSEGEKERAIAKAALSVAELGTYFIYVLSCSYVILRLLTYTSLLVALLDAPSSDSFKISLDDTENESDVDELVLNEIPLRSIRAVTGHIPAIESARTKITAEMETMVLTGLATLVRSLVTSCILLYLNRIIFNIYLTHLASYWHLRFV